MTDIKAILNRKPKPDTPQQVLDRVGAEHGFVDRAPRKKTGVPKGPRQAQLHPKMKPEVADGITAEANELGITQGHLIEVLWAAYTHVGRDKAIKLSRGQ